VRFRTRTLIVAVLAVAVFGFTAGPAQANLLSVPNPLWFWDGNDDGVPSGPPDFDSKGPYWSASHLNRLNEATAEWRTKTSFNPGVADGTGHNIYVDGRLPPTDCSFPGWVQGGGLVLAVTCKHYQERTFPARHWYRLIDDDIFFNMEVSTSPDWWVGAAKPAETTRFDFGGVLTHELGHTVRLVHVYDPADNCVEGASTWITMCPYTPADNNDTYWSRSLHADDISGANYVY